MDSEGLGMSDDDNTLAPESQISIAGRVDQISTSFEAAWQEAVATSGQRPRIEQWLEQSPAGFEDELLRELLAVELELRYSHGEACSVEEYLPRFPRQGELVAEVCAEAAAKHRLADYVLLEKLGQGGMGVVYRALHVMLDSVFAVKVLDERRLGDLHMRSRFLREMRSIGSLRHPNVVQAHNAGEANGRHFLVMEYVEGPTLHELVNRLGPLPCGAACEAIRQAALGLQHAHEHGLVHRDVKPGNLILTPDGTVKVLDLGLARFTDDRRVLGDPSGPISGDIALGTADYMPPEQWEKPSSVDIRADIYALGCTLFYLLTGRPPFDAPGYETLRKKLMAHSVAPIPKLTERMPDCPEDVEKIVEHMLAKEPDDRFDTPGEVAEAVGLFANPSALQERLAAYAAARDVTPDDPTREIQAAQQSTDKKSSKEFLKKLKDSAARQPAPSASRDRRRLSPVIGAAAAVFAILLVAFASWWIGRQTGTADSNKSPNPGLITVPSTGPVAGETTSKHDPELVPAAVPDAWTPARRDQISLEIQILPISIDEWWFDELPWFVPFARQAVVEDLDSDPNFRAWAKDHPRNPNIALQPDTDQAQLWLKARVEARVRAAAFTPDQQRLLKTLLDIPSTAPDESELRNRLTQACNEFAPSASGPDDLHTLAVLKHKLARIANTKTAVDEARAAYEEALRAYAQANASLTGLHRLCLLDLGWLFARDVGDAQPTPETKQDKTNYEVMLALFDRAMTDVDDPFVKAHILTLKGMAACLKEKYSEGDVFLRSASQIFEQPTMNDLRHPFQANIYERMAWSATYRWRVDEARALFDNAWKIRGNYGSRLQQIYALHSRHGMAMAERFQGKVVNAVTKYQEVLDELPSNADTAGQANPQLVEAKRRQRLSNTSERRADCELYHGAASKADSVNLAHACDGYATAKDNAPESATKIAMALKLAIARELNGQHRDAWNAYDGVRKELETKNSIESDKLRITLLKEIADGVVASESGVDATERKRGVRELLDKLGDDPDGTPDQVQLRAEILELYLFCAEMLVAMEMDSPDAAALPEAVEHLWRQVQKLPGSAQLRPYLRRYCEVGVEASLGRSPKKVVAFVRRMRGISRDDATVRVVFFLPEYFLRQRQNVALVIVDQECESFELAFDRETVTRGERDDQPFALPEELVQRMADLRREGREVRIEWSDDGVCWPKGSDDALTEANQPEAVRKLSALP